MTEPTAEENEVSGLMPDVDHSHGHHGHGVGVPWLDVIVAVSAVFISVVSLWVSIEHGKTMEKMVEQNQKLVAASTMPLLTVVGGQLDPVTSKPRLRLILRNGGVGPAVIDKFEIRYKGKPFTGHTALLQACCADSLPKGSSRNHIPGVFYSNVSGNIMPARDTTDIIEISEKAGSKLYNAFDAARRDLTVHACYCSVLDECWETDFDQKRPTPVKQCTVGENDPLW